MILVLNAGSSSIKYTLFKTDKLQVALSGSIEISTDESGAGYDVALDSVMRALNNAGITPSKHCLSAIGHRVVHGGAKYNQAVVLDDAVITAIRESGRLAPLHNPIALAGIQYCSKHCSGVTQVAVFDTAFHQSLPPRAHTYALPKSLCDAYKIRRYGFHGTSHLFVAKRASEALLKPLNTLNLITIHLGNGSSMAAIHNGFCVDTSMGMSPLEGLVMGTRSGELDPSIIIYLQESVGLTIKEIKILLNHESGLKGMCGLSDMRQIHEAVDAGIESAQLAIDVYCYRIQKMIGSYMAVLGRVDGVVFTGGVGENDAQIRQQVCLNLHPLGIQLDNHNNGHCVAAVNTIHKDASPVKLFVIKTDEALEIAAQTKALIET